MYCCIEPEESRMVSPPASSRTLVEDYILHKVKSKFTNFTRTSPVIAQLNPSHNGVRSHVIEASDDSRSSNLKISIRTITYEYERRYERNFPDVLEQLRATFVTPDNIAKILQRLSRSLFRLQLNKSRQNINSNHSDQLNNNNNPMLNIGYASDFNWGHVIGLLFFSGVLAEHAVERDCPELVEQIISWVSVFFDTELAGWMEKNGGWETIVTWSNASNGSLIPNYVPSKNGSVRSIMSVSVLAACVGFGALIMSRK